MCINYCYLGTSERRLNTGGEGDGRGWDGWMASPTQWTWVWASFGSWWWTGKPDLLQSMGHKEWDRTEWPNWKQRRGEGLSWEGLFSPPLLHWEVTHLALTYLHSVPASHFCINQIKPEVPFVTFFHEKLKLKEEPKHTHKSLLCPCYCSRHMPWDHVSKAVVIMGKWSFKCVCGGGGYRWTWSRFRFWRALNAI